MRQFLGFWVLTLPLLLPACTEPEPVDDSCNQLVNDGGEVVYALLAGAAPTPAGGTIALGKYELTALNLYGVNPPMSAEVRREVIEIAGTSVQWVLESDGEEARYASNFTTEGTTVHFDISCPNQYRSTFLFTATPMELRLLSEVGEWSHETVFLKR
jgi:hypothetical protein